MNSALSLSNHTGKKPACEAFNVPRASFYRYLDRRKQPQEDNRERPTPPLALSTIEKQSVLDTLYSERFQDKTPYEAYATLLDDGVYYCSISTMYRFLNAEHGNVEDRRRQVKRPNYSKPELLATMPKQVWSWDITKLKGPVKWTYFYLYVIMDIFSRYVVGWMVAHQESTALAKRLIEQSCIKQNIEPEQLTLHADRGSSMKSKGVAQLLADLGITKTHNRPYVSNDNPYSESQFKTLKYCPEFPGRFGSIQDSRAFCQRFFSWYNEDHYHSGIALMTPENVHYGMAQNIYEDRVEVLKSAFDLNPKRFKGKVPKPPVLPKAAWINKPAANSVLYDQSLISWIVCLIFIDIFRRAILKDLGYSLRANDKSLEDSHPDRDEQFRYISKRVNSLLRRGLPVISVDTKKKELIGNFANKGTEWRKKDNPRKVKGHDFHGEDQEIGIPYGIYDQGKNLGWVNVGCDHDTSAFAVQSIQRWWSYMGNRLYPDAKELLICADSGGSNGYRVRLWKLKLQEFVDKTGLEVAVCHFPRGTSKWNKIEHRLFSHISMNWKSQPLTSHDVMVNLIGGTKTKAGLKVKAKIDKRKYPIGIKVSDVDMRKVNLKKEQFHGEWNYRIMRSTPQICPCYLLSIPKSQAKT